MAQNTKARNAELHAAALRIVGEFGIANLDSIEPETVRRAQLSVFYRQLEDETGCVREAARQHIAKAARRLRSPVDAPMPDRWGGARVRQAE